MKPKRLDLFKTSRRLIHQYEHALKVQRIEYNPNLIDELEVRAEQLDYLVEHLRALEDAESVPDRFGLDETGQVRLFAEAFYFFAHRLLVLCRKNPALGLQSLKCESVAIIRNQLIEHTEGSGRHEQSLSWNLEDGRGPVLKGCFFNFDDPGPDRGLFRNAEEMRLALEATLTAAIIRVNGAGEMVETHERP